MESGREGSREGVERESNGWGEVASYPDTNSSQQRVDYITAMIGRV